MKNLPVLLNVKKKTCLIVGGGKVAMRRAKLLSKAGMRIDLVSKTASDKLLSIVTKSGGIFLQQEWRVEQTGDHYVFIIAATDSPEVNIAISEFGRSNRIAVNVASDAALSDIAFPSIIDRDPITISVSSGTASPVLTRSLICRIDALIPAGYGKLANLVSKYRKLVNTTIEDPVRKQYFWQRILTGNVAESIFSGNPDSAESLFLDTLKSVPTEMVSGEVYLIGAGPGDPDLLTFRAYRLLQQAEVVFYDRLVSERILDQINPDAEMVYVGKKRADHSMPQQDINQHLVDYALSGKRVARLKGGDPFIFGRGGEEIELLAANRVPFQVVPGITAASGCAAYSGIPLTHRDHAQSVRFVTGQLQDGTVDLPWHQLVAKDQTVVIYMGLVGLPVISENLIKHGMDPDTPAAMIEQGTTMDQRIHCSTIENLPALIKGAGAKAPTLLIVGTVVSLHDSLRWFNPVESSNKPFSGTS